MLCRNLFSRDGRTARSPQSHQLVFALAGSSALSFPMAGAEHGVLAFGTTVFCALVLMRLAMLGRGGLGSRQIAGEDNRDVVLLVRDGLLQVEPLEEEIVTREEIFEVLRGRGVFHLGQVARLYREPNGAYALVKRPEPKPGLCVWPSGERGTRGESEGEDVQACTGCGRLAPGEAEVPCDGCRGTQRDRAVS